MHRTHSNTHGLVSSEESVQQDRATGNHHHRSQGKANDADDRVDCHKLVCSWYYALPYVIGAINSQAVKFSSLLISTDEEKDRLSDRKRWGNMQCSNCCYGFAYLYPSLGDNEKMMQLIFRVGGELLPSP